MKKLNRVLASLMALLMALSLVTVSAFADEADEEEGELAGGRMPIGSTPYSIQVPEGYYDAGVTQEDVAEGMISTYVSDDTALYFDVYEFAMSEVYPTLEAFITADCAAYNGTELTLDGKINGVTMTSYRSEDEYNGETYYDMNYAFEYEGKIVQIDFYWLDSALDGVAEEIMSTFQYSGTQQIIIGNTDYSIMIPTDFTETEITDEDYETGLYKAYSNHYTGLEIEIYYFENEAGATLQEAIAAQAEAYNGTILDETEINGIPMGEYVAVQTYDGVEYQVYVVLLQDANGAFSAVAFYLNNYCGYIQAEAYMHTLGQYDPMKDVTMDPMAIQLGSSGYSISLPYGFMLNNGEYSDFENDGLIASYVSPYTNLEFDVYQSAIAAEESDNLAGFTEIDAAKYDGTEIDLTAEINGIPMTIYRSVETYDEITFDCLNYTFVADDFYFVQLCFYWNGDDCSEDVASIMDTLAPVETMDITLAGSKYAVTAAGDSQVTEMTVENDGYAASFVSSDTGAPFFSAVVVENTEKLSLEDYVSADCAELNCLYLNYGENGNGVTLGSYRLDYTEPGTNDLFDLFVCYIEDGDNIVMLDFVVRNYSQYMQAVDLISSIKAA